MIMFDIFNCFDFQLRLNHNEAVTNMNPKEVTSRFDTMNIDKIDRRNAVMRDFYLSIC